MEENLEFENQTFYQWMEELKSNDLRTWFAYLMRGGNSTFVGLKTGKSEFLFTFKDMGFDEARRHLKFKHLRTNLDDGLTMFDRAMLKDCRRIAENAWYKDCGLGYRVKEQGR